jgi:hypothetical protein
VETTHVRRSQDLLLGRAAAAGPILFAVGWALAGVTQEGFRPIRDDESALAAVGAAHPWITMTGDTLLGIGFLALAALLAFVLDGRRRTIGCSLLVVAGITTIVQAIVREDCVANLGLCTAAGPPETTTWQQWIHDAASGISFLAILIAALVLARPIRDHGRDALARYSTLTGGIGFLLLIVFIVVSDSSISGLAEFVFLVVPLSWAAVVGLSLAEDTSQSRCRRKPALTRSGTNQGTNLTPERRDSQHRSASIHAQIRPQGPPLRPRTK